MFVCTPLSKIVSTVEKIAPFLSKTAILTDVGSVKASIVEAMMTLKTVLNPFVGGHPMSGTAKVEFRRRCRGCLWAIPMC